jgi:predicted RND superfamily exporter protein
MNSNNNGVGGSEGSSPRVPGDQQLEESFGASLRIQRIADLLIRWRLVLLGLCLGLGLLALPYSWKLQFDRSLERLFHESDPRLTNYLESKEVFGAQETCVVAFTDPDLVSAGGFARLEAFEAELAKIPGVDSTMSLARMRRPSAPLSSKSLRAMLETEGELSPDQLKKELVGNDLYRNRLISPDGNTTAVLVTLKLLEDTDQPRAVTIESLREAAARHPQEALVAGGSVLVDDVFSHLEDDGKKLGIYSTLVMTLVIALMFRNVRWMLMPLVVVHLALVWTKASMVVTGMKLSMVSSPLVALVTVIGVGTVVHFAVRFREYRSQYPPMVALRGTLCHVGPATFWTVLTTVAGFASLMVSRIVPVQSFGLMMGVGTMFVLLAVLGLIAGAVLLGRASSDPQHAPGESSVAGLLNWINGVVERHPWWVTLVGLASLAFLSVGTTRLESATDFTDNFQADSPIVQSYQFISERLGATGGYDLMIDSPSIESPEFNDFLKKVADVQQELSQVNGIIGSLCITDLLKFMQTKPDPKAGTLMERMSATMFANMNPREQVKMMAKVEPTLVSTFWNQDKNVLRISVLTSDIEGNQAKIDRLAAVEEIGRKHFPTSRSAGSEILIMFLVNSMLADQWTTFSVAVIAIFVMLSLAFRSLGLGLIAMVPNVSPILIVIGTMGWLGLKLNMATAMLASVSMGLAVDFSIHYLARFRHEQRTGSQFEQAIRRAHGTVGLAIILANLALIAGFMVLTLSEFVPTVQFGFLVTVVMLGGLSANLIVLPMLLRVLRKVWPSSIEVK